jgi:hypothetical protein
MTASRPRKRDLQATLRNLENELRSSSSLGVLTPYVSLYLSRRRAEEIAQLLREAIGD